MRILRGARVIEKLRSRQREPREETMAVVQLEILHPNKSVREVEAGRDGIGHEIGGFRANRRWWEEELEKKR